MFGAKRKRISRACDRCHKLGRKCAQAKGGVCQPCVDHGDECTYNRPQGKRGVRPKGEGKAHRHASLPLTNIPSSLTLESVIELVEVYRVAVYPVYCFFSWPHLTADIKARRHETDPAFQATVLAMCAIVAARIRDGACNQLLVLSGNLNPDAEELQRAANAAAPALPLNRPPAFDDLRAAALLTVLAMQNGGLEEIHTTLGRYITLSALLDFHDERKWPADLAEWQLNERRALYWSTYTQDVFVASVWGGVVRHRDSHSFVEYPDWHLDSGVSPRPSGSTELSWTEGWNVVTDFYRTMDRIMDAAAADVRWNMRRRPPDLPIPFSPPGPLQVPAAWTAVGDMYGSLPSIFKHAAPLTGNLGRDMYSFQAANLNVTLQAVKMSIACSHPMSMAERCAVASELLDSLAQIPTAYMLAISAPFLHQLGGVASLLGSVVQGPLTVSSYLHVRQILLAFGNLLAGLETSLTAPSNISKRLFDHVARIDAFMQNAAGISALPDDDLHTGGGTATGLQSTPGDASLPSGLCTPVLLLGGVDTADDTQPPEISGEVADMVFTLPDDILQFWPFEDDQPLVLDSFFRAQ